MPSGSKPGERRGGRKAGTPNKRALIGDVSARLQELGCDPIEGMALLALDEKNTPELRGKMYGELAQYLYPKRKSIEHSGPDGGPIETGPSAARERIASRIAELALAREANPVL